jgi:hypothetical protein
MNKLTLNAFSVQIYLTHFAVPVQLNAICFLVYFFYFRAINLVTELDRLPRRCRCRTNELDDQPSTPVHPPFTAPPAMPFISVIFVLSIQYDMSRSPNATDGRTSLTRI